MRSLTKSFVLLVVLCLAASSLFAQRSRQKIEIEKPANYSAPLLSMSPQLESILASAVRETLAADPGIKNEEVAATLIDLRTPGAFAWANVNGEKRIYPASVVKMFYMAALERQMQDGKIVSSAELERGLTDMIVVSSNEATQYILDVLTDTSSGAEMPEKDFEKWQFQRNRVNRFYSSLGYQNINVNQKTFCEDAYGVEQQTRKYKGENRNMLTTNATARLLAEIVTGRVADAVHTKRMMDLMKRDPFAENADPDSQARGFSGKLLLDRKMTEAKLWSKAGWTSKARHDAAYIETPEGLKFVIVVFTENHANEQNVIPTIVGKVIDAFEKGRK
ncbi:MAG: serine hydrolase [Acidobacteriota bacterium]